MAGEDDEPETIETVIPTLQPTVNAATPKGLSDQAREQFLRERDKDEFWRTVLGSVVGRREMWTIIAGLPGTGLHAFNPDFGTSPLGFNDPNAAWYQRGQQDYGLKLYHELFVRSPALVLQMHTENDPRFKKPEPRRGRKKPDAPSS